MMKLIIPELYDELPGWAQRPTQTAPGAGLECGFPSGHTALATSFSYSLMIISAGTNIFSISIATLYSALIGLLRVYVGAHTIQQVTFGYIVGLLSFFYFYGIYTNPI